MKKPLITLGIIAVLAIALLIVSNLYYGRYPLQITNKVRNIDSAFKPYLTTTYEDGLTSVDITRSPWHINRTVETSKGEEEITILDGYRALYAHPDKLPFLKVFTERTTTENFEKDKSVINRQFQFLAKQDKSYTFRKEIYNNHEYYLAGDPTNRNSGTVEIGALFFPEDSIITTIYFFNQGDDPAKRDFETTEEYERLRDAFIKRLIDLASKRR